MQVSNITFTPVKLNNASRNAPDQANNYLVTICYFGNYTARAT